MTESFLQGMKGLFEDHYVHIPEEKYDVLENMVSKLDEMEARLNEQIESNISLNKRLGETTADGIFREVTEDWLLHKKRNCTHCLKVLSLRVKNRIARSL